MVYAAYRKQEKSVILLFMKSIIVALKEWLDYNIQDRQFIIFYRGMNVSLSSSHLNRL